jgi:hypothetical protein
VKWLQDLSQINGDNLNIIRHAFRRNIRNKKRKYLQDKVNENKKIGGLYKGTYEFKQDYRPRTNLVIDVNSYLLTGCHNILNGWKNNLPQLLNARGSNGVKQMESHEAKPLIPEISPFQIETDIALLERFLSAKY